MLAVASRDQTLLAFLALADIEAQTRKPLLESNQFSSFLLLLIAAQPDAERVASMAGASATLANGLAAGHGVVSARSLPRYFPREAPQLQLALNRLRLSYGHHPICPAIVEFIGAVNAAKEQTIGYIINGFHGDAQPIALKWRAAAAAGARVLRALDRAFGERNLSGLAEATSPLIAFLDETAGGGYSALDDAGEVKYPMPREGREYRRVPVRCDALVHYTSQLYDARLRDMSVGGLGLEGLPELPTGANVQVDMGGLSLRGRIEWMRDGRAGIKLDVPLEAEDPRLRFLSSL